MLALAVAFEAEAGSASPSGGARIETASVPNCRPIASL